MILHIQASPAEVFEMVTERYPERRFELVNGETIEKVPNISHNIAVRALFLALSLFLLNHPIGWVFTETRHKLPDDDENDRVPDLSFIRKIEGRAIPRKGAVPFMPELAVEVQSPGQSKPFMREKAKYYLDNGSRMVWIVYPDDEEIEFMTAAGSQTLTIADTLTGGDVLPDFTLAIKEVFTISPEME